MDALEVVGVEGEVEVVGEEVEAFVYPMVRHRLLVNHVHPAIQRAVHRVALVAQAIAPNVLLDINGVMPGIVSEKVVVILLLQNQADKSLVNVIQALLVPQPVLSIPIAT